MTKVLSDPAYQFTIKALLDVIEQHMPRINYWRICCYISCGDEQRALYISVVTAHDSLTTEKVVTLDNQNNADQLAVVHFYKILKKLQSELEKPEDYVIESFYDNPLCGYRLDDTNNLLWLS